MPTPFPGMDPYLERARVWEEVHTRLIVAMADECTRFAVDEATAAILVRRTANWCPLYGSSASLVRTGEWSPVSVELY